MRLLICGGTGFIGQALTQALLSRREEVCIVTRKKPAKSPYDPTLPHPAYVTWEEWNTDPDLLSGFDAIINLSGETINQRWTSQAKQRIVASRVDSAIRISHNISRMANPPQLVIQSSGISLYGHSGEQIYDESSPSAPADFLGETVVKWEKAADQIRVERLVKLRIGLVCASQGGAFPLLRLPYRLFFGGRMGDGQQGLPWIHLQDMIALILFCLDHPTISGPVNAVAPEPVSNHEFGEALGRITRRPHWFPVPSFLLKLVLGEMSTLVLTGQKAMPRKLLDHGFKFEFPRLEDALKNLASSSRSAIG